MRISHLWIRSWIKEQVEAGRFIMRGKSILFIIIPLFALSSFAMPPKPGLFDEKTGRSITTGDRLPEFPEFFGKPIGSAKSAVDVTGVGKMAAVLVDFPDRRADSDAHPQSDYQTLIFSTGEYPTGSLNEFYIESSYGLYSVEGDVYGWLTTSQQYSYFDDGNYGLYYGGPRVAEAAAELSDPFVDYSNYDNDGPDGIPNSGDDDGYVDAFTVIHAGLGGEDSGSQHDIWSHSWAIDYTTNDYRSGGGMIRISSYTIQPEERLDADGDTLITAISVLCHEYGHILGLPDLYDPSRYTWGIGYWGLMGYGAWGAGGNTPESPAHPCAWSKVTLGWIDPVNIHQNSLSVEIPAVEENPVAYKIWRNGNPQGEYFLLENRQLLGFDSPSPGHGLLIWHYDSAGGPYYDRLNLEQADGLDELDQGDGNRPDPHYYHDFMGDDADPFPGSTDNHRFGPDTNPSSDDDQGRPTNVIVGHIAEVEENIVADLVIDPETYLPMPGAVLYQFGCESILLSWNPPEDADPAPDGYNVYRRAGTGEWELRNDGPVNDTTFVDAEIIIGEDVTYGISAIYGGSESSMSQSRVIYLPDPSAVDYMLVGDTTTSWSNDWYKSILDSLGLRGVVVEDILPYCGETLAALPVLWIVSFPGDFEPIDGTDREIAIINYLDVGGRLFADDGLLICSYTLSEEYLLFGYSGCIFPPFIHVYGNPGTFAEGMSFVFPDLMPASYLWNFGYPPESNVLLAEGHDCSCVAVVTNRLGFKAVINSQPLYEMVDGPGGTRLELFDRMLGFFDVQTGVDHNEPPAIPSNPALLNAYPNPFNAGIRFSILSSGSGDDATIEIFDITGRLVRVFADVGEGITWDGRRENGSNLASGIYFARLRSTGGSTSTVKLTLMK